jgi:hypothetical protein
MECKKCGATIADVAKFCPNCGEAVKAQKTCPNCNNVVEEDASFCVCCGQKLLEKNVCKNCGAQLQGAFCTACGTNNVQSAPKQKAQNKVKTGGKSYMQVVGYLDKLVTPIITLTLLAILFICSFFIGHKASYPLGSAWTANFPKQTNSFYYFIGSFASLGGVNGNVDIAVILQNVFSAIAILTNFIIQIVFVILGSIKCAKSLKGEQGINVTKYAISSFASFFATAVIIASCRSMSEKAGAYGSISIGMSDGSCAGIAISVIFLLCIAALKVMLMGKDILSKNALKRYIPAFSVVIVAFILPLLVSHYFVDYSIIYVDTYMVINGGLASGSAVLSGASMGTSAVCLIGYFYSVSAIVVSACLFKCSMTALTKEKIKLGARLALSIVSTILIAITILLASIFASQLTMVNSNAQGAVASYNVSLGLIVAIFMALACMAGTIVARVIRPKNTETM